MRNIIILFVLAELLNNCGSSNKSGMQSGARVKPVLSIDSIYDYGAVSYAVTNVKPANRKIGSRLFLQALGLYRNKKRPESSVDIFKKSIAQYPNGRAYYELGNALMDLNEIKEANDAFQSAQQLEYKPVSKLYYNMACCYAMGKDTEKSLSHLRYAFENGYKNKANVMNDKDLNNIRNTEGFKVLVAKYLSGKDVGKRALFALMETGFKKTPLPFSINKPEQAYNDKSQINYDYASFVPGMEESGFGRDVSNYYSATASLVKNDTFTLLAVTDIGMVSDTLEPVTTRLVSYDANGKIIDKLEFACACTPMESKTGEINAGRNITVKQFNKNWKFDPKDKGYAGNKVIKTTLTDTKYYHLEPNGQFKRIVKQQAEAMK